jgi:hypothetical protein
MPTLLIERAGLTTALPFSISFCAWGIAAILYLFSGGLKTRFL